MSTIAQKKDGFSGIFLVLWIIALLVAASTGPLWAQDDDKAENLGELIVKSAGSPLAIAFYVVLLLFSLVAMAVALWFYTRREYDSRPVE